MKVAKVLPPCERKGSKTRIHNYKPKSILPTFAKIFENFFDMQIHNELSASKIISEQQNGFQKIGTCDALIQFTSHVFSVLNYSLVILGILFDFPKAFDVLNLHVLLQKLKSLNFTHYITTAELSKWQVSKGNCKQWRMWIKWLSLRNS